MKANTHEFINGLCAVVDRAKHIEPTTEELSAVALAIDWALEDEAVASWVKTALQSFVERVAK